MNPEAVLVTVGEVLQVFELVAEQFGLDKHQVLRFAAEKLPALVESPKDEIADYNAARNIATSER